MTSSTGEGDGKVVQFPATAEERRALQRAKQEAERKRLADLFVDEARGALFHTPAGECFADIVVGGVRQTWPIRSKRFRAEYLRYLRRQFERLTDANAPLATSFGPALKKSGVNAAIDEFEMKAVSSPIEREVHARVASDRDHLFVDLGDPEWRAVRITTDGWAVVESPPIRFRRTLDTRPLPIPERGGSIGGLRQFLPSLSDDDFILIVAILLHALQPHGPFAVLVIYGRHGSAKTTHVRLLRALTDPHRALTTRLPTSSRDLYVAARNSHVQAFENVSQLSRRMSDDLCRLATGGGMRTRALWTDADEATFTGARPIMMDGINAFVTEPDLLSRSIILTLAPLTNRRTERELYAAFDQCKGGIFGALCDMLATGLKQRETCVVDPPRTALPRMADFSVWCAACGLDGFEAAYARNRELATDVILEHDPLAQSVEAFMATRRQWQGSAWELLKEIGPATRCTNPRELSDRLRRLAPLLLTHGISVSEGPRKAKQRPILITQIEQ